MSATKPTSHKLPDPIRKTCDLFRLLAGHEVHGLSPTEISKGMGVTMSWVSVTLPPLVETGFIERVPETNRWRLGVTFVRISITVATNLNKAKQQLDELATRYSTPL